MAEPAVVRALEARDVPVAADVGWEALREAGTRYGYAMPELDDDLRLRQQRRVEHLLRTDPDGVFVADAGGTVVGVAMSLRRGPLWFLSLLAVARERQAEGLGRALLDATLRTAADAPAAMIMSSPDPKALRRYASAGFALQPGYDAAGTIDRTLLPAVQGVREGDWARDREWIDALGVRLRGAAYGPDLDVYAATGRLVVADGGFAVVRSGGPAILGAHTPEAATALLWTALAEGDERVEISPLTAGQQWAVQVALQARLTLSPGASLCVRGAVGPLAPYLPSGAYG